MATDTIENVGTRPSGDGAPEGGAVSTARGPGRLVEFLGEVRAELKRVTWPSQAEVYATTIVVILTSLVFGLYLFGIDLLLNSAVQRVFQRFGGA
ncbi:MAG: preprotein translocase subunit SecE [Vicinamibacterales bacterium]